MSTSVALAPALIIPASWTSTRLIGGFAAVVAVMTLAMRLVAGV